MVSRSLTFTTGWTCAATTELMDTLRTVRFVVKPLVFMVCLLPMVVIVARLYGFGAPLGANPIETIQDWFGVWGLRFLLIGLAVTPLRKLTGTAWIGRFRRMLGLFGFFYVLMHFVVWLVLDQAMLMSAIIEDIFERPFITIGMAALVILLAMAATSTAAMRRRLGRRWQTLHYGAYAAAILGVWHYWWQVKQDITEPLLYALVLLVLLGYRFLSRRTRLASRQLTA